jgi:hypothetical protein
MYECTKYLSNIGTILSCVFKNYNSPMYLTTKQPTLT